MAEVSAQQNLIQVLSRFTRSIINPLVQALVYIFTRGNKTPQKDENIDLGPQAPYRIQNPGLERVKCSFAIHTVYLHCTDFTKL